MSARPSAIRLRRNASEGASSFGVGGGGGAGAGAGADGLPPPITLTPTIS